MEVVFYAIYIGAALLFSLAAVFTVGGALHAGTRRPDGFLVFFVLPMVLVMAASTIASGRNLLLPIPLELMVAVEPGGWAKWLQRFATLFLLAASVERLAHFAFNKRQPGRPLGLMVAFAGCWVSMVALPAAFGARPSFGHEYVYSLLIGLAALTTNERGGWTAIRVARDALLLFVLGGLLLLIAKRSLVLAPYVGGLIPGFPWRYSGLSVGPNAMGPISVLALLCLWALPMRRRWLNAVVAVLVVLSLLLTQSKSSWLAALACAVAVASVQQGGRLANWLSDPRKRLWARLCLALAMGGLVLLMLAVGGGVGQARIERFLASRAGADLMTLTGRNEIWAIALETFWRNPWFGYGPSIWDPLFRYQIGVPAAFHAHNQFINVLAASGLVGALGFSVYFVVLLRRLLSRRSAYRGFAMGLFVLVLMRSISEVPFNLHTFGSESLALMLLLMVLAGASGADQVSGAKRMEASGNGS